MGAGRQREHDLMDIKHRQVQKQRAEADDDAEQRAQHDLRRLVVAQHASQFLDINFRSKR